MLLIQCFLQLADSCCTHPACRGGRQRKGKEKRSVTSARKWRGPDSGTKEQKAFKNTTHLSLLAISSLCLSIVSIKSKNCERDKHQRGSGTASVLFPFLIFLVLVTAEDRSSHSTESKQTGGLMGSLTHQTEVTKCRDSAPLGVRRKRLIFLGFCHLENIKPVTKEPTFGYAFA